MLDMTKFVDFLAYLGFRIKLKITMQYVEVESRNLSIMTPSQPNLNLPNPAIGSFNKPSNEKELNANWNLLKNEQLRK